MSGMIAGLLIGLGVIINTQMENPIIGAMLFSFGLLTVIALQVPLYTGRIGFISKDNFVKTFSYLFENIIGILLIILIYTYSNPIFYDNFAMKAQFKFEKSILEMFLYGIICGMLIHFVVKVKREIVTIFAVMIFILVGSEHCIADAPYLMVCFSWMNLLKYIMIVLGNSVGAIFIERSLTYEICRNDKK